MGSRHYRAGGGWPTAVHARGARAAALGAHVAGGAGSGTLGKWRIAYKARALRHVVKHQDSRRPRCRTRSACGRWGGGDAGLTALGR